MRITTVLMCFVGLLSSFGKSYSQNTKLSLEFKNSSIENVLNYIESRTEYSFMYDNKEIDISHKVNINVKNQTIESILDQLFENGVNYQTIGKHIIITPKESQIGTSTQQSRSISGKVADSSGASLPGVSVVVKGTSIGIITDTNGNFTLSNVPADATLLFSFVGMKRQEIKIAGKNMVNVVMEEETVGIEEVVAVGYGSMKKSDLTGSVIRADIKTFADQPNVSIMQTLQGTIPGLNVGSVQQAGESPVFSIRGRTSLSGEQQPLIVLDEVIFRGNLIDLNPADIEAIDILKDNSATAVYGSQAANGVIIITSKSGKGKNMKPSLNYSSSFGIHTPAFELRPGTAEDFINKNIAIDFYNSRTAESGYLKPISSYDPTYRFKTNQEAENYRNGLSTDWYDLLTNDNIFIQNHNLSLSSQNDYLNFFISVGATLDKGYMLNEDYKRYNARINVDNHVTDWLTVGIQSFFSLSDYSGLDVNPVNRYRHPYDAAYDENGKMVLYPGNVTISPLVPAYLADDMNKRNNFSGNIYAKIDIPFIKGLSYKINFHDNYETSRNYTFKNYDVNFQGSGNKIYTNLNDISSDNILTYKRTFNKAHNLDITLLYGFEKRKYDDTESKSTIFINQTLGYNSLESGSNQTLKSGAWEESSLYSMGRLFYNYKNKYMVTGTIRRDGFSGFSENHKFGLFPSVALGWVPTEESFFPKVSDFIDYLKLRVSYGSNGNRTINRYQTLARVSGMYGYVDSSGKPMYSQSISSMASPDLKWETTTGLNLGVDFRLMGSRITGSIEYYNNNTKDILYNIDIPSISRFNNFPTNLGKLHNHGIEVSVSSENFKSKDFTWQTDFVFSRNRDELKELLGFDNDGDGKEDDLISARLFIGQPLNVNYHYEITGELYQLGDKIPAGSDVGAYVIIDQNKDGKYNEDDYKILNYPDPSYRFSITNKFRYKNWSLNVLINSIQGGKKYYYAADNLENRSDEVYSFNNPNDEQHYTYAFPNGLDYWLPENSDAKYQRIDLKASYLASRYTQRNFVRLQDVTLSYDVNTRFLKKINVEKLRLFLSGKNLVTWTKWPGWDPETGIAIGMAGRPVLKSYTLGLDIVF